MYKRTKNRGLIGYVDNSLWNNHLWNNRLWIAILWVGILSAALLWGQAASAGVRKLPVSQLIPQAGESDLILVGIASGTNPAQLESELAGQGLRLVHNWPGFDLAAVTLADPPEGASRVAIAAQALPLARSLPVVRFAEPDGLVESASMTQRQATEFGNHPFIPSDALYPEQWALETLRLPDVWGITRGSSRVVVAVLDSGAERTHEDLGDGVFWENVAEIQGQPGIDDDQNGFVDDVQGWNFVDNSPQMVDGFGHGTHVIGSLVAQMDNGRGIAGMVPNSRVMPLRILSDQGSGFVSDLINGLVYAKEQGAQIVNLSLVLRFDSLAVYTAIETLHRNGVMVVAATGNYGSRVYWPAAYVESLAVAATDPNDKRATFSNLGEEIDIAAPGVAILSTFKGNRYERSDGTSMAVPHVAGLAALIWSLRPDYTLAEVEALILESALDVNQVESPGLDSALGYGRIDPLNAINISSEGLSIHVPFPSDLYLSVGQQMRIPVQVTAGEATGRFSRPVEGAVVTYEIRGPTAGVGAVGASGALVQTDSMLTDPDGYTILELTLPEQPGEYDLVLGVGQKEVVWRFAVQDGPRRISFTAERAEGQVGSDSFPLYFQVFSQGNEPVDDKIVVELTTDRGTFSDGSQHQFVVVESGVLTETFHVGKEAGSALVRAEALGQSYLLSLIIRPGEPKRLVGQPEITGLLNGAEAKVDLTLSIEDAYGNQVWSPYRVNFHTLYGRLSASTVESVGGQVSTRLTLGVWNRDPVQVWATLPGSFAIYRGEASYVYHEIYLPEVRGE